MSSGGGGNAADRITATRMVTGLKRAYPLTRQELEGAAEEEEMELSLGLAIGGSKGKAIATASPVVGPIGRAQVGRQEAEIRTRNPVAPPGIPMTLHGPLYGTGFPSMFAGHAPPQVVSGSGRSGVNPIAVRSLPALANPSLRHCTRPQCLNGEMGGKRMRRAPSVSGSSAGGRSSSSSEHTQSDSHPNVAAQEAMSRPRATPPPMQSRLKEMPCVMTRGIDGRKVTGVLYRYNNETEIIIVCICHGRSFTPAGFVRHAGGVESSHPMRQIVLVRSSVLA